MEKKKVDLINRFSAKRLALMAVFVALSYVVSWFDFPIFPAVPFLELDFGNVFILLISFLLGPMEGVIVCVIKESLRMIGGTVVGELANMMITCSFILVPAIVYQFKKGLKWVVPCLAIACVIATGVALLTNRFINFPLYAYLSGGNILGMTVEEAFSRYWLAVLLFNLIKTVAVSLLTVLLYKRLSNFLKRWKI